MLTWLRTATLILGHRIMFPFDEQKLVFKWKTECDLTYTEFPELLLLIVSQLLNHITYIDNFHFENGNIATSLWEMNFSSACEIYIIWRDVINLSILIYFEETIEIPAVSRQESFYRSFNSRITFRQCSINSYAWKLHLKITAYSQESSR